MNKVVLHHIASDYGKRSSIGFRSEKIYNYSQDRESITIICRSNKSSSNSKNNIWPINLSYFFSRIFAFIRIYLISKFPARKYELFIFNFLSVPYIILHYFKNIKNERYFHSWDSSFWLLYFIKKLDYFIIKDCAMTPSKSSLKESEKNPKYYFDNTTNLKTVLLEKKIFDISNLIISPSEYTSNFITKEYKINASKVITIPFGADLFTNSNPIKKSSKNIKAIKFGFVGLVNMRKGIRWLIKDLNDFHDKENYIFELHIFGRIFKEEINLLNKTKFKIIKYGFIDTSKNNIYENFDILIHPSFVEGSAKCIYEAMSSGLPIICTKQSGSIVEHKRNGFIINTCDSDNLKKYLKYFFNNKNEIINMGLESKKIMENYTWEKYAYKINFIYQREF